jgi:hypothetical protein
MRNVIAKLRPLAANLTFFSHLINLEKHRRATPASKLLFAAGSRV